MISTAIGRLRKGKALCLASKRELIVCSPWKIFTAVKKSFTFWLLSRAGSRVEVCIPQFTWLKKMREIVVCHGKCSLTKESTLQFGTNTIIATPTKPCDGCSGMIYVRFCLTFSLVGKEKRWTFSTQAYICVCVSVLYNTNYSFLSQRNAV